MLNTCFPQGSLELLAPLLCCLGGHQGLKSMHPTKFLGCNPWISLRVQAHCMPRASGPGSAQVETGPPDPQSQDEGTTDHPAASQMSGVFILPERGLGFLCPGVQTAPSSVECPPHPPSHPSKLIQSPCLSFLRHTAHSHWLSILHMVV